MTVVVIHLLQNQSSSFRVRYGGFGIKTIGVHKSAEQITGVNLKQIV